MAIEDKIFDLERQVELLTAQISGLIPCRIADGGAGGGSSGDDFPRISIKNVTGGPLARSRIVGYGSLLDAAAGSTSVIPRFNSAAPVTDQPFAVLLTGINVNEEGHAAPVGAVAVQVYVNDVAHNFANAAANNYDYLSSSPMGFARIVWRQNPFGTGLQWCRVLLWTAAGAAGESGAFRAITTTVGSKAAGIVGGNITPGIGAATLYSPPGLATPPGTAWTPGAGIVYENWIHATIAVKKPILLRASRTNTTTGGILYEIITEGCEVVPDSLGGQS